MAEQNVRKRRRERGSGTVYLKGRIWWIAYRGPDGLRKAESSESTRKGDATRLLRRRVGARENGLPVVPNAEKLTFNEAAKTLITRYEINKNPSLPVLTRRISKHLTPFFNGRRMAGITGADVLAYVAHRKAQGIVAWKGKLKGERVKDVSNSEINRELATMKLIFNDALKLRQIGSAPYIEMLKEPPPRTGFFEADEMASVLRRLPSELAAPVEFAFHTGWRIASEVLPMEWKQVDLKAGTVRLEAGTTKNEDGRLIFMKAEVRRILEVQDAERQRLRKQGTILPLVFFRMRAERRGGEKKPQPIGSFKRAWQNACNAAGLPGKRLHDLRRTAIRNLDRDGVSRTVAMKMVGQRTESIYNRYNITSEGDLRDAARKQDAAAARSLQPQAAHS